MIIRSIVLFSAFVSLTAHAGQYSSENASLSAEKAQMNRAKAKETIQSFNLTFLRAKVMLESKTAGTMETCYFLGGVETAVGYFKHDSWLPKTSSDLSRLVVEMSALCHTSLRPVSNGTTYVPSGGTGVDMSKAKLAKNFSESLNRLTEIEEVLTEIADDN